MSDGSSIDVKAAAKLLGVSPSTLYNYRSLGIGPPSHTEEGVRRRGHRRVYYKADELRAWLNESLCPHCGQHVPMWLRQLPEEVPGA